MRIISAGAFHNLVLWLVLASASWLGVGTLFWSCLGYQDVSAYGRVVLAVEEVRFCSLINVYAPC